jgi:hypothetical protein
MLGKLELCRPRKVNLPAVATGYDRRPHIDGYPHWLIIVGAILLMLGLLRRRKSGEKRTSSKQARKSRRWVETATAPHYFPRRCLSAYRD